MSKRKKKKRREGQEEIGEARRNASKSKREKKLKKATDQCLNLF